MFTLGTIVLKIVEKVKNVRCKLKIWINCKSFISLLRKIWSLFSEIFCLHLKSRSLNVLLFSDLRFDLKGVVQVKIRDSSKKYINYSYATEDYDIYTADLLNLDGATEDIDEGIHNYNFDHRLPTGIPYSAAGRYGQINYIAEARLVNERGGELRAEREFKVACYEDLKWFPELLLPVEENETFANESLLISLKLTKSGFGLNEKIPVDVEIANIGKKEVSRVSCALMYVGRFETNSPTVIIKEVIKPIAEIPTRRVPAGKTITFKDVIDFSNIPMLISNRNCKYFRISFKVVVKAEVGCSNHVVSVPVVIASKGSLLDSMLEQATSQQNKPFNQYEG